MQHRDSFPISKNKIRVPHRHNKWIARSRLIEALHDELEKQLLLVVAPAGYGKTTLLVDMAHDSELPVCWLSLDTLDKEPQRFLTYFISAIAEKYPEFGKDTFAVLRDMKSFERDGEQIVVALTNEIADKIREHFVFMLDDFQIVGDTLIIRQLLSRLLQLVGENFHLILASRSLPDFPDMPRLVVRDLVGGLSYEALAFTAKEVQQLFSQNKRLNLSDDDAQALVDETEGWVAAIQLSGGKPGDVSNVDPLRSTRELFDFFGKEILARQPKEIQRFLLLTSFFNDFDVALCEEVLSPLLENEEMDWSSLFTAVQTENLFSVLVDERGRWMRYHHLFQHFLKSKLRYDEPVLAWHIQKNLARIYEKQESWEAALQLYEHLEDRESFSHLLVQVGPLFIRGGRILTLASWLERLPVEVIYAQPSLLSLQAVVFTTKGDAPKAIEFFSLAEKKLRGLQKQTELALTLVRRAEVYRHLGRYDDALNDAALVIELAKGTDASVEQNTYAEALRIKGLSFFGQGRLKEALSWLDDALRTCRTQGLIEKIPILETELGVVYRRLGEPETTARYYESALNTWQDAGNTEWKARLLNNLGLLYHKTGRLEDAVPLLEESLEVAEKSGLSWLQANEYIGLGDIWTDLGDFDAAQEYYDQALTLATQFANTLLVFYATLGEARLMCLNGNADQALKEYQRAKDSQVNLGLFEQALLSIEKGSCLLMLGESKEALKDFRLAAEWLDQSKNDMEQASAQLWAAAALYEDDPESAIKTIKDIVPKRKKWGKATPLMIAAGRAGSWLKERGHFPLKDPLVSDFFKQADQIAQSLLTLGAKIRQKTSQVSTPPMFEFKTFGPMSAIRNGHELQSSNWQTREAKELFFFFLQSPPISKEKVGLVFWPDISPARLKMRFKINVYRIRQALGQEVVLFEEGRYRFNKMLEYKWDRDEFDQLLDDAHESPDRLERLSAALDLVQGPYMADADLDWTLPDRLRYGEIVQQTVVDLADAYLEKGWVNECYQLAQRSLEFEPLAEAGHRLLLQVYAARHDKVSLMRQYQHYEKTLEEEMGLLPSSDLTDLYNDLIRQI